MHAKYLFVMGPKAQQFSAIEDIGLSLDDAKEWGKLLHEDLKPHFLRSKRYAYVVYYQKMAGFEHSPFLVATDKGEFYKAYIGDNPHHFTIVDPLKVRRIELIGDEFYCTDEYIKGVSDLRRDWPHRGMQALDP